MLRRLLEILGLLGLATLMVSSAWGQNGGGVFGPIVPDGHRLWDYRYSVDDPGDDEAWVQRIHYEAEVAGNLMWRVVGQWRNRGMDADTEVDFARGELFIDAGKVTSWWHTGFRVDAMVRNGKRPDQFNAAWTNQFALGEGMIARVLVFTSHQVGDNAADGVSVQTRALISKKLSSGATVGFESYDPWGSTENFVSYDDGRHQVGPFVSGPVGPLHLFGGLLFGTTQSAPDLTMRVRVIKRF